MRSLPFLPLTVLLAGCLRYTGLGPDVGACATYPDEPYTYGEAGIGRCLAGPADLAFHVADGHTWLAVTNADPFRIYASGSYLEIDADALRDARGTITADQLPSYALETEPFVGGLSFVRGGDLAVVASRYTAGSSFRRADDRAWFVDVTDPTHPRYHDPRFVTVGADPYGMAQDDVRGLLYVLNATDTSVSVLDVGQEPPRLLDPAPASVVTTPAWEPRPGSIGRGQLDAELVTGARITATDGWTATWVEGSTRLWVPTPQDDAGDGLARWSTGGDGLVPTGFGVELDATGSGLVDRLEDPWAALNGTSLLMYLSDGERLLLASTDGDAGDWTFDSTPVLSNLPADAVRVSGPSVLLVGDVPTMFYDGRPDAVSGASIWRATSTDGVHFATNGDVALVAPTGFDSVEQPSALVDPSSGAVRVWATARVGDHHAIVTAASPDDGSTFGEPEVVLDLPGRGVGAPFVTWIGGRFVMWLAVDDGAAWAHATAWSYDGLTWSDPEVVLRPGVPITEPPPRAGVQPAATLAWRVQGQSAGLQSTLLVAGTPWTASGLGLQLAIASGHDVGTDVLPNADHGVVPGSIATVQGEPTLYVTARDADDRPRLAALRRLVDRWVATDDDLVPEGVGGNVTGASDPAVFVKDGVVHLIYAAHDGDRSTMRHATSTDGLHFQAVEGDLLPTPDKFASVQQAPHALVDEGGTLALWYGGFDGSRWRIGKLTTPDLAAWTPVRGATESWVFGPGDVGAFDDSGVRDPMPVVEGDHVALWYSAFDGEAWRIGVATIGADGVATRRLSPVSGEPAALLSPVDRTFSARGVQAPVAVPESDGTVTLWYAGTDGTAWRLGAARGTSDGMWPHMRFPTPGDRFRFATRRGEPGRSKIELGQVVENFVLPGAPNTTLREGPTSAVLDRDQGLLYVGSEDFAGVVVVDVRDDSTDTFDDLNYLDIETVLRFDSVANLMGITAMVQAEDGRIYLSSREPDGVLVLDPSSVIDDADKELVAGVPVGILPLHDNTDDDGTITFAAVGAAGLALVPSQDLLVVTHLRDNSVSIFDLSQGAYGVQIRQLEDVGENPSTIAVSPDETWAVIGSYLGQAPDGADGSSLAVLDLDPSSPTYLQIRARVVNQ